MAEFFEIFCEFGDIFGCSMAAVSKGTFTAAAVVEKIGCLAVFFYLLAILYSRREKR